MESSAAEVRYERKFVLDGLPAHFAEAAVRQHPALFREEFPPRLVNSIYLDSPALRNYYEHRAGVGRRAKIRIRWYAALFGPVSEPHVELKRREGACNIKNREPAASFQMDEAFDGDLFVAGLRRLPLPAVFLPVLIDAQPVLVVRFHRRYFRSADGRIRATIDAGMEFRRIRPVGNSFLPRATAPGLTVLELKYAVPDAGLAANVADAFPFRVGRMSKYVLGLELVGAV